MVIGIGTDIVEVARIEQVYQRQGERFVDRILRPEEKLEFERRKQSLPFLAKRFAAKEAIAKALQTGIGRGVSFQDIEVGNNAQGAPVVELHGGAKDVMVRLGGQKVLISLADERDYALAYVILSD